MKKGAGFARRVTANTLERFRALLRWGGANRPIDAVATRRSFERDREVRLAEQNFPGASLYFRLPFTRSAIHPPQAIAKPRGRGHRQTPPVELLTLVWRKTLSRTDAQRQEGNPTGDLRLTRANFRVRGSLIDNTKYFRNDVFACSEWLIESQHPLVEVASVDVAVFILGVSYGVLPLLVSHKPTGEAGQHNYTTGLRWGVLLSVLRNKLDLTGRVLNLHAPSASTGEPFVLTID